MAALDLSTAESGYHDLMKQMLPTPPPTRGMVVRQLVIPGNPAESRIVNMMHATGTDRMPPDRPLAEADIALVEQWILEGAQDD